MKTTKKDFALFKQECEKWLRVLQLTDWDVIYHHGKVADKDPAAFSAGYAMNVAITFGRSWNIRVTRKEIKKSAFHEVGEILLAQLNIIGRSRYIVSEGEFGRESHAIINRLYTAFASQETEHAR